MKIPPKIVAPLAYVLYRLWCGTLRYTQTGREEVERLDSRKQPMVFCGWHDELFPLLSIRGNLKGVTVVSRSRDGEYLARLLQALGFATARGSSSKGGESALLQTARLMREQKLHACITVDGPRGPRHVAKKGAVFLAQRLGAPLVPVRLFMARSIKFKSWDRFQLPLPFSRVEAVFGTPYYIQGDDSREDALDNEALVLQNQLESMKPSPGFASI